MLKKFLIAGILVWVPIVATSWIVKILVNLFDQLILLLPHQYQPETLLGYNIPGLGFLLTFIVVLITGILATNFFGKHIMHWTDKLLKRIPFVGSLYSTIKQVVSTIVSSEGKSFRKVLLIEYPRKGLWSIAFLTNSSNERFNRLTHERMLTVFVPTTPNPTSGFLIIVPESQAKEVHMTVEEAFKIIVSLGTITN